MALDFLLSLQPVLQFTARFATSGFMEFICTFLDQVLLTNGVTTCGTWAGFDLKISGTTLAGFIHRMGNS
jgi:hypothetical protein